MSRALARLELLAGALILFGGAGAVLLEKGAWWTGPPSAVAIFMGTALLVLSAFDSRIEGEFHGFGFDLRIGAAPKDPEGGPASARSSDAVAIQSAPPDSM